MILNIKSVVYSSQGNNIGQLDFKNTINID